MRENYLELGSAIAVRQIQDYLNSAKMLVNLSITYLVGGNVRKEKDLLERYEASREQYRECRQFLLSSRYDFMTETNGTVMKDKLDAKVREYGNQILLRETKKTVSGD